MTARIPLSMQGQAARDQMIAKQNPGAASRELLFACDLFRGLAADERQGLIGRARTRQFVAEETIFLMGAASDSMMAILSGRVQISVPSPDGNEVALATVGPGEIFGEIGLLDGGERTADAKATTECSLAILYRRDILAFLDEHPAAWWNIVSVLCERLRRTDQQISDVAMVSLPVRLAKTLLRIATIRQDSAAAHGSSQIHLTQRQLGKIIGATRESVNKHLGKWQRKGVIQITKGSIVISDRSSLENLAQ